MDAYVYAQSYMKEENAFVYIDKAVYSLLYYTSYVDYNWPINSD